MQRAIQKLRISPWIVGICIVAFAVRLMGIGQSFWLDEATTAKVAWTIPFWEIPLRFSPGDFHPPAYYLFISLWSSIFGLSEVSLRMPSVLFSLVAGVFVYKTARIITGEKNSLVALLVFLLNPLVLYYSQEARMYMMAVMLCSAASYCAVAIANEKNKKDRIGANLALTGLYSGLAIGTFYGSAFFVAALCGYLWFTLPRTEKTLRNGAALLAGPITALLILSPLLFFQFRTAVAGLKQVHNWGLVLGKNELKNIALIPLKFAVGRISWFPKWQYYTVGFISAILFSAGVVFGALKTRRLWYLLMIPVVGAFVTSFAFPMMQYFRFLYLMPVVAVLIGAGGKRWLIALILIMSIGASIATVSLQQFYREDWRSLAADLNFGERVFMIIPSSDPILYYQPIVELQELRTIGIARPSGVITVIPYVTEVYGFDYQRALSEVGCVRIQQRSYRGLQREKWNCRSLSGIMNSIVN